MSIRLRLALLYSGILALTLIVFSLALYFSMLRVRVNTVEQTLADQAARLAEFREFRGGHLPPMVNRFAAPETYLQVLDGDGHLVNRSANLNDVSLPLTPAGLHAIQAGRAWAEPAYIENQHLLVYSRPMLIQGRLVGIIQVASSMGEQDQSLAILRTILLLGILAATLTAFGAGWLLAGTALAPIARITQTAQAIGRERDFGRRVEYTGPNDELGRLATTFNAMLGELQAAFRQTEQALQAQLRFVADASHELRTPLTTIRGNLALLQREPPIAEEDRVGVLADLVDECDRLIRLVQGLLTLARADAGQTVRREPVEIKPLVEDVARQSQVLAEDRALVHASASDVVAVGDRDALKQVLLILIDNAMKYTPAGGVISLSANASEDRVAMSVSDTGPGIAPDVLPHIFKRFYRGDVSRTGNSAGLGLAIAKSLVEAQQGSLSVESRVGAGSTFTVTLPRVPLRPASVAAADGADAVGLPQPSLS